MSYTPEQRAERSRERSTKFYAENKEKAKLQRLQRYRANKTTERLSMRDAQLMRDYGITRQDFDDLIEMQAGLCAMCCEPMKPKRGTHVDRDHETNKVRGLLCIPCNVGLGRLENKQLVTDATSYLNCARMQ